MIDYNKLFDILYSDTIPFSVKENVVENVKDQVNEDISEAEESPYIDILNSLAYSDMSEDTTNEIIDKIFGNLDEAEVEQITYAFIKENCLNVIINGEIPILEGSTDYVGLAKIDRDERNSRVHGVDMTKKSPLDKLKGAVDKVKTAAKNSLAGYLLKDRPTGLSQIKGLDKIRANKPKEDTPKAEHKADTPKAEGKWWRGQGKGVPDPDKPIYAGTSKKETGTSIVPVKAKVEEPKEEPKQEGTKALTAQKVHLLPDLQKRKEKIEKVRATAGKNDIKKIDTKVKKTAEAPKIEDKVETPKEEEKVPVTPKKEVIKNVKRAERVNNLRASASKAKAEETPKAEVKSETPPAKTENAETKPRETIATSDKKFNDNVKKLREKMGVPEETKKPTEPKVEVKKEEAPKAEVKKEEASKAEVKKEEASKAEVKKEEVRAPEVKKDEAPKAELKTQELKKDEPLKVNNKTKKAESKKEAEVVSPFKKVHNHLESAAAKRQGKVNDTPKQEKSTEVKPPEVKTEVKVPENKKSEAPKKETKVKAQTLENNKSEKVEAENKVPENNKPSEPSQATSNSEAKKVDDKVKKALTPEEREAKLQRIRYKREAQETLKNTTKAVEDLQAQLDMLSSKPGTSSSDIDELKDRLAKARENKTKAEEDWARYATHESFSNSTLNSLLTSSISESTMEEILEMICCKSLAHKAEERELKRANDSLNNLNKVIEVEAETGKSPVTAQEKQALIDRANKHAEAYEKVKASVKRKYG